MEKKKQKTAQHILQQRSAVRRGAAEDLDCLKKQKWMLSIFLRATRITWSGTKL